MPFRTHAPTSKLRIKAGSAQAKRKVARRQDAELRKMAPRLKTASITTILKSFEQALNTSEERGKPTRIIFSVNSKSKKPVIKIVEVRSYGEPDPEKTELANALEEARERGRSLRAEIISRSEMLSADEFAKQLGTTRQTVNEKRKRHEVLALNGATRGFRYPAWQIREQGDLLPDLPKLFEIFGDQAWTVFRFLTRVMPGSAESENETALDALRAGRSSAVLSAASAAAEGGFD